MLKALGSLSVLGLKVITYWFITDELPLHHINITIIVQSYRQHLFILFQEFRDHPKAVVRLCANYCKDVLTEMLF